MFRLEHENAVRIVSTEKKRDELIKAGYKLIKEKGAEKSKSSAKAGDGK